MKDKLLLQNKNRLILIICLSILLGYFVMQYALMYRSGFPSEITIKDSIINSLTMMLCCYAISTTLNYYIPKPNQIWKVLIIGFIMSGISILGSRLVVQYYLPKEHLKIYDLIIPYRYIVNFLILTSVAIFIIVWNIQEEYISNIKRKQDSENQLREAELYNLRQQLQPHFLFNSLNSIIALIGSKPEEARNMTFQLSDFLRGTLRKENNQLIVLQEELNHLELYLDIEKVRFGHRLYIHMYHDQDVLSTKIPAMILQPLVENAIKHGLYNVTENVTINIKCFLENKMLHVSIENPFDPSEAIQSKGTGFGLTSIERRLFLLFGRNDLLTTHSENNIFTSSIKIPQYD
ncbi:sensor histidine kinase [Sphingobacterium faecium]|uniref:sensor histidine kinase n=1 Tax=Sphingobacterium faecium TaxID=34087 RepID=UPI00097F2899|nr:histidine kinase [Sphingobacterium faecium]WGQ14168.1 histidine kinase [Sphingobacterium faecium]SJN51784.1 Autolysin sensor kinase [Sphingobacterium faecium PCAi_F2.5]